MRYNYGMNQKISKADELFFVVDAADRPLQPLPRKQVHGTGVWHRASHVVLVNGRGEILCHRRALSKELDPGMWVAVFGGHLGPRDSYESAAKRELQEETGIVLDNLRLWRVHKFADPAGSNNEFQAVFVGRWDGQPSEVVFDDGEVEEVKWFPLGEVQKIIRANDPGWFTGAHQGQLVEALIKGEV